MSKSKGKEGEDIAINYLIEKGYRLIERNFLYQHLEIDIIVEMDELIVFVEVKSRGINPLVPFNRVITRAKQRHIIKAADFYLKSNNINKECRFDVITILRLVDGSIEINHIENAFIPQW